MTDRPRAVLFPHAGGNDWSFASILGQLRTVSEPTVINYPARGTRRGESAVDSALELAHDAAGQIAALDCSVGLALIGHSLGAIVAFETARVLHQRGLQPGLLVVSGREAPHRPPHWTPLHSQNEAEVVRQLVDIGGLPPQIASDEGLRQMFLPSIMSDLRAAETYRPDSDDRLTCPIVAVTGVNDPLTRSDGVLEWASWTSADMSPHVIDGGHMISTSPRYREIVVAAIASAMYTGTPE